VTATIWAVPRWAEGTSWPSQAVVATPEGLLGWWRVPGERIFATSNGLDRNKCHFTPNHFTLSQVCRPIPFLKILSHISVSKKDFCLIPIGSGQTSVAEEIAECQRVLAKTGLKYKVGPFRLVLCSTNISLLDAVSSFSLLVSILSLFLPSGYGTNIGEQHDFQICPLVTQFPQKGHGQRFLRQSTTATPQCMPRVLKELPLTSESAHASTKKSPKVKEMTSKSNASKTSSIKINSMHPALMPLFLCES